MAKRKLEDAQQGRSSSSRLLGTDDDENTGKRPRVSRHSRTGSGQQQPRPDQLGFYSPLSVKILQAGKSVYRRFLAIQDAFPGPDVRHHESLGAYEGNLSAAGEPGRLEPA
jgi:hypothetical protein